MPYQYIYSTKFGSYAFNGIDLNPNPGPRRPFNFFGHVDQVKKSTFYRRNQKIINLVQLLKGLSHDNNLHCTFLNLIDLMFELCINYFKLWFYCWVLRMGSKNKHCIKNFNP